MKLSVFGTAVERLNLDTDIFRIGLGVFDEDIEIPIVIEYPSIDQLILRTGASTQLILLHQFRIWEFPLRILVQHPHVAVSRSVVEVKIIFLYIFTAIAFLRGHAEVALFEDRIAAIP